MTALLLIFLIVAILCATVIILAALDSYDKSRNNKNRKDDD